ncbi:restriction endonuclease subunit S [Shewanella algae]|uniref:restriction endonuclease subunit S n=1 Tax=Shewanella algae TaxID=38313 RepID=UPI001AAE5807|nr:restriction endonuclease subunit S [Shewanella algae]
MSELPKGWTKASFDLAGDYTDYVSNGSFASLKENVTQTDVEDFAILLRLKDFNNSFSGDFKYITESSYNYLSKSKLEPGDLFLSNVGAPGKTFIIPDLKMPMSLAPNGIRVRASSITSNKYLHYFISSPVGGELIDSITGGNAQQKFNKTALKKSELPLAPLNEQIRIANKLDSILANVDKAQARLDKIPAILKRFRQSVLAAATSGELTKEWREEMGFTRDTWLPTSIDSLSVRAFDGPFGSKLKTADYTDHGIKVARLENIGHLVFNAEKQTFISEKKYQELVKNTLEHKDVLFSSFVDEEIRTCLFDERFGTHINKADCFCIRPNQEMVSPEFLMYSLACKHTYEKIKKQVHGATRPRVNLRFLKSFEIALPSPKEQAIVVDKINQLFSKANKVEKQYLEAKARLDRLTQSILAKAFRGELVSQDPNDEPAEKLLKRIVAEKEQSKPKKATRKRSTKAKAAEKE